MKGHDLLHRIRLLFRIVAVSLSIVGVLTLGMNSIYSQVDVLPAPKKQLDRSTPRQAMYGFLKASRSADYATAAHYLDLRSVPPYLRAKEGPILAHHLSYVIDAKLAVDLDSLMDTPDEVPNKDRKKSIGTIVVREKPISISLSRVMFADGIPRWMISRHTVDNTKSLYEVYGPGWLEERIPAWGQRYRLGGTPLWKWTGLLAVILVSWLAAYLTGWLATFFAVRLANRAQLDWLSTIFQQSKKPVRLILTTISVIFLLDPLKLSFSMSEWVRSFANIVLVCGLAWFMLKAIGVGTDSLQGKLADDTAGEMKSRGLRTQIQVLRRVGGVIVITVAIAVGLLQFQFFRNIGVSLLASAGVAGVAIGFAAQKWLGGVVAGIQLSIAQPIRVGDGLVVDKQFCYVEKINITYVVLRTWDLRRIIVPVTRFLDQPFENWTKVEPEMMGAIMFPVDFSAPVDVIREEFKSFCTAQELWNSQRCDLVVLELSERSMTLRAVVSANDPAKSFDLCCLVREHMMKFLRELDGGRYLPKVRSDYEKMGEISGLANPPLAAEFLTPKEQT
jgi:small-conductance mechanosensitive channel